MIGQPRALRFPVIDGKAEIVISLDQLIIDEIHKQTLTNSPVFTLTGPEDVKLEVASLHLSAPLAMSNEQAAENEKLRIEVSGDLAKYSKELLYFTVRADFHDGYHDVAEFSVTLGSEDIHASETAFWPPEGPRIEYRDISSIEEKSYVPTEEGPKS